MPLMHQEDAVCTQECIDRFTLLVDDVEKEFGTKDNVVYKSLSNNISAAKSHHDVVAQFGRYPSRNVILGREPTEAEKNYDGPSWG